MNVKSPQEFIEGTDAVVECPAYFGDPPGRMEWLHYHSIPITDDRYTLENGRMKIQNIQKDDEGVYRCIVRGMGNFYSKFITVVVLEWDELAPRIVEPNDTIEVAFGEPLDLLCQLKSLSSYGVVRYTWTVNTTLEQNHFHNTTPSFHTNAYQFRGGRYICRAENEYGYDEKVFHVRILSKSVHTVIIHLYCHAKIVHGAYTSPLCNCLKWDRSIFCMAFCFDHVSSITLLQPPIRLK